MEDDKDMFISGRFIQLHKDASQARLLLQNGSLFSQVVENLPFPVALFERSGSVVLANRMLQRQAGISEDDIRHGKVNLLDRVTDENCGVFEAVEDVFLGDATVVRRLVSPLSLFAKNASGADTDPYRTAVFFPVPDKAGSHGAVMLTL